MQLFVILLGLIVKQAVHFLFMPVLLWLTVHSMQRPPYQTDMRCIHL